MFTAVIGMFLATPGMAASSASLVSAHCGIALVAGAAAAFNCLVEQKIDGIDGAHAWRPLPSGELTSMQTLAVRGVVGGVGLWHALRSLVNPLTMWLTLATFVGYAVVYTVMLKPLTPQNIVIGGASGAMPPVLGWAAMTGRVVAGGAAAVPHHLRLDAAALLGARAVPHGRLRAGRPADAAGDARRPVHAPARAALHPDPVRGDAAAVRLRHERR